MGKLMLLVVLGCFSIGAAYGQGIGSDGFSKFEITASYKTLGKESGYNLNSPDIIEQRINKALVAKDLLNPKNAEVKEIFENVYALHKDKGFKKELGEILSDGSYGLKLHADLSSDDYDSHTGSGSIIITLTETLKNGTKKIRDMEVSSVIFAGVEEENNKKEYERFRNEILNEVKKLKAQAQKDKEVFVLLQNGVVSPELQEMITKLGPDTSVIDCEK